MVQPQLFVRKLRFRRQKHRFLANLRKKVVAATVPRILVLKSIVREEGPLVTQIPAAVQVYLAIAVQVVSVDAHREPMEGLRELVPCIAERVGHVGVPAAPAFLRALAVLVPVSFHIAHGPGILVYVELLLAYIKPVLDEGLVPQLPLHKTVR